MQDTNIMKRALDVVIEERVCNIAWKKAANDVAYKEAEKKRDGLFRALNDALTSDAQRVLLDELENTWNNVEGLMYEFVYRQGIEDSPKIHKELIDFGVCLSKKYREGEL